MTQEELNQQLFAALNASEIQVEAINALLQSGADVNATDDAGYTPLMHACSRRAPEALAVVALLLDNGANARAVTPQGYTALYMAIRHQASAYMAEMLLLHDDDAAVFGKYATFCLLTAVVNEQTELLRLLLETESVFEAAAQQVNDKEDYNGYHSEVFADAYFDEKLRLIDKALLVAAKDCENLEMVALLLEYGANANSFTAEGCTIFASVVGDLLAPSDTLGDKALEPYALDLITLLHEEGANPFLKKVSPSAWEHAVYENNTQLVERFLSEDFDMKLLNLRCGYAAFPWAMRHITRPELLRLFLERGADVNTPGTDGKTPLLIAVERAGVAGLYKGTGFRKLREANLELVRCLLAAGAEANLPSGGVFPIVSAARALPGTGLATLQAFADATTQTGCGVTPLSVALYYADAVCAELLLSAGANLHTPACGFTPMQLAAALIDPTCCNLLRTPTTPQN